MRAGVMIAACLGGLLLSSPALSQPPMIDGHYKPERTSVSYRWLCSNIAIRLGYWEEFRDPASVGEDLARAL